MIQKISLNYNINATENDDSCVYPIEYYDCNGICLNDMNSDGICDENQNVSIDVIIKKEDDIFYPNPADSYLNVRTDNLFLD